VLDCRFIERIGSCLGDIAGGYDCLYRSAIASAQEDAGAFAGKGLRDRAAMAR
jgi:hypothetical protein